MRQGATSTIVLLVQDYDLSLATHVWVTFDQAGTQIVRKWEKYPDDPDDNDGITVAGQLVTVKLSQEETLGFDVGTVTVQAKMKEDDFDDTTPRDTVKVTVTKKIKVEEGINKDVM